MPQFSALKESRGTAETAVRTWEGKIARQERQDSVAREEPLEIRVRGSGIAVTMRTPDQDEELAIGFLLSEGLIRRREDVLGTGYCKEGEAALHENILNVFLAPGVEIDFERLRRHVYASSSCGLCGKASIDSVHQHFSPTTSSMAVSVDVLYAAGERLRMSQPTFAETGGLHAAGIFDERGNVLVVREDIGRHNAVDKVIGRSFLDGLLPLDRHILLVSGRASFEIMQKALAAGIPVVAAVSAPSSLAVEFAKASGQTLVGFLRGQRLNLYAGGGRITGGGT